MSDFKDRITKQVETINNTISNEDEKARVLGVIQEMLHDFTSHVIALSERQNELEDKISDLLDMYEELGNDFSAEDTFENCPYCGEEIPVVTKDDQVFDIVCPNCHNIIEMEMVDQEVHEDGADDFKVANNIIDFIASREASLKTRHKKNGYHKGKK